MWWSGFHWCTVSFLTLNAMHCSVGILPDKQTVNIRQPRWKMNRLLVGKMGSQRLKRPKSIYYWGMRHGVWKRPPFIRDGKSSAVRKIHIITYHFEKLQTILYPPFLLSCLIYQSFLAHLARWYHHFQLAESIERSSLRKDVESCRN